MDKQKLIHQLFIGKVAEFIGQEKAIELLKEAKHAIESIEPQLTLADASASACEHPFASVMSKCNGEINHCLKCGKHI